MIASPSIYVPGKVRTTQTPLFDTLTVASGAAMNAGGITKMFTTVSGVGPNITNMQLSQQLPGGVQFLVKAMRCVFLGSVAVDIAAFCLNNTVRFYVGAGNIAYADAPAEYWAGGAGVNGQPANGIPDPRAIVPFDIDPVLLTDGVNFRVDLVGTPVNATAAFALRVYLDGQLTVPAQ
jgi:hypothetical protein